MVRRPISASLPVILALGVLMFLPAAGAAARGSGRRVQGLDTRLFYEGLAGGSPLRADSLVPSPHASSPDSGINHGRLAIVGGTLLGSIVAIHLYQQSGWWKDNRTPFHFQEDLVYGLSVDKVGHFYGASLLAYLIDRSVRWANVPDETALWYGSGGALLFQTYVEIEDGFSAWGFDRVDFASDVAGAAWPIGRYYLPALRAVDLKLSYHPSDLLGNPGGIGFKGQKHLVIDDYEGQTFWLSFRIHDLAPEPVRRVWPEFLCLALGYGAREVAGPDPYRVYFLALDLDMTRIIPRESALLKSLGELLNFIHFPLPAVQFSRSTIWYGLYF
jgi:hypothetical protein